MEIVRQVAISSILCAALLGAVGWAAELNADEQTPDGQAVETPVPASGPGHAERNGSLDDGKFPLQELLANCRRPCRGSAANEASEWMRAPRVVSRMARQILDPRGEVDQLGTTVVFAIFVVLVAVLTQQAIIGYREWRLSFACFPIVFLLGFFGFQADGLPDWFWLVFASAFFAGVLSFWLKYMLELLATVGAALVVVSLVRLGYPEASWHILFAAAAGVAGGVWLHWWRGDRRRRKPPAGDGQTPAAGAGAGGGGDPC